MDRSDHRRPPRPTRGGSPDPARPPLAAERVAELRRWIARGGYNAPEVVDAVARRLIQSGDLER